MKNLVKAFAILIVPISAFGLIAYFGGTAVRENPDVLPPFLRFLDPETGFGREAFKFLGTLFVAPAIWGFFYYLSRIGNDSATFDGINGIRTLKLRAGVRVFMTIAALALCVVFALGFLETEPGPLRLFFVGFGVLFAYAALATTVARVRFDRDGLSTTTWRLTQSRHDWSHLTRIERNTDKQEYHFHFAQQGVAKVSFYYAGLNELLAHAAQQLPMDEADHA